MPQKGYNKIRTVAVIAAHPDDETLWTGGTIFINRKWKWFVVCLCRANDPDRATKFYKALKIFKAEGIMGDLDDSPVLKPLSNKTVEHTILELLPQKHYDLIVTHNPNGEYTRHIRHEEAGKAVIMLWHAGKISTDELWIFAYEDGNRQYCPQPEKKAHLFQTLSKRIWLRKYRLITETYGYGKNSWEAEITTRAESFWKFTNSDDAKQWLDNGGVF